MLTVNQGREMVGPTRRHYAYTLARVRRDESVLCII